MRKSDRERERERENMLNRSSVVMLVFWWPEILFVDNVVVLIGCMPFVC